MVSKKQPTDAGETDLLEKIDEMPAPFRDMGLRLHEIITENAPALTPRTWYGMPAYEQDGRTVCFFRVDDAYMTFGFTEKAELAPAEDVPHQLIPSAWFFTELDDATEVELTAIVRNAVA